MERITNLKLEGSCGRIMGVDIFFKKNKKKKSVVIFCHGFKGFKDWGHFNKIAEAFAEQDIVFVKFNFSHNGTTYEQPNEFVDLEAFGNNNFSKELNDLGTIIDFIKKNDVLELKGELNTEDIHLIGHSRGGGTVLLKAAENSTIKTVTTWASVAAWGRYWSQKIMEEWKEQGVHYVTNGRTKQNMPLYFQIYEDYFANKNRLDITLNSPKIKARTLLIHGTNDDSVPHTAADELNELIPNSKLVKIQDANHVFGGKHPFNLQELSKDSQKVLKITIEHIKNHRK